MREEAVTEGKRMRGWMEGGGRGYWRRRMREWRGDRCQERGGRAENGVVIVNSRYGRGLRSECDKQGIR
jgi:hypothetical protein